MILTHIDTCAGIGGFSVALRGVSKAVLYCEKDLRAQGVIRNNIQRRLLDQADIVADVRDLPNYLKSKPIKYNILTAGIPCTGFSLAGKRAGFSHADSEIYTYVLTVIKTSMPDIVLLENTPQILKEIDRVVLPLNKLGYTCQWILLSASAAGGYHKRERFWMIGYKKKSNTVLAKFKERLNNTPRCSVINPDAVPRTRCGHVDDFLVRCKMLGNAIVPFCARQAWQKILGLKCDEVVVRNLRLSFKQSGTTVTKPLWPTPRAHANSKSKKLTVRTSRDLVSAIWFEQHTEKSEHVNINWIEVLMGYPIDWTKTLSM